MNEIVRHIEYLLLSSDCVVVPGLGAVLAHNVGAHYSDDCRVLMPPTRTFTFNSALSTHNDGALVWSVAREKSITYEAAAIFVEREVDAMHKTLAVDGRLSLGLAGDLVMTDDRRITFEPRSTVNLSPSVMWLQSLDLRPISELARRRDNDESGRVRQFMIRAGRVAASIVALIALGFVLTTPISIDNVQHASLGVENFKPQSAPKKSSEPLVLVLDRHSDAVEVVDTVAHNRYVELRRIMAANPETDTTPRFDENDHYCVVIASLATEAEAQQFIESKNIKKSGILSKDGRYRVYAATGQSVQQAQTAAGQFADSYPGAWVCRK